jgi:hypothetical protein
MSESEAHARLVSAMLRAIQNDHIIEPFQIRADLSMTGEHARTFSIASLRPDVIVVLSDRRKIVGEAKTAGDVDTLHTRAQLKAFFEYLLVEPDGILWMSVPMASAGEALRVARTIRRENHCERIPLVVSGWLLGARDWEQRWYG